jgi:Nuclear protein Es2
MSSTPAALREMGLSSDAVAIQAAPSLKRKAEETALSLRQENFSQSVLRFKRQRVEEAVLPERDYTNALSHIIERDFYPDLPRLQQQLRYLEAVESGDQARIAQIEAEVAASLQMEALEKKNAAPKQKQGERLASSSSSTAAGLEAYNRAGSRAVLNDSTPRINAGQTRSRDDKKEEEDDDAASVASWSAGIGAAARKQGGPASPQHSVNSRNLADFDGHEEEGGAGEEEGDSQSVYSSTSSKRLNPSQRAAKASTRMGLNAFMLRYTGEDNASFTQNFKQFEEARARRHWWLYQQVDGRAKLKLLRDGDARALLPHESRNNLMITDESAAGVLGQKPHINTWVHRPKNALFFGPDLANSYATSGVTNWQYNPDLRLPMAAIADSSSSSSGSGAPRLMLTDKGTAMIPASLQEQQAEKKRRQQEEKRQANLMLLEYHVGKRKAQEALEKETAVVPSSSGSSLLQQLVLRDDQALPSSFGKRQPLSSSCFCNYQFRDSRRAGCSSSCWSCGEAHRGPRPSSDLEQRKWGCNHRQRRHKQPAAHPCSCIVLQRQLDPFRWLW